MVLTFPCSPNCLSRICHIRYPAFRTNLIHSAHSAHKHTSRLSHSFTVWITCFLPRVLGIHNFIAIKIHEKDECLIHDFIGITFRNNSFGYQFHWFFPKETMTFGKNFSQKLDAVQLPENLQLLSSEPMGWTGWRLPQGLMGFNGAQYVLMVMMGIDGDWWEFKPLVSVSWGLIVV